MDVPFLKTALFLACILLSTSFATSSADEVPYISTDSERFVPLWRNVNNLWAPKQIDNLRNFKVIFVGGLFSQSITIPPSKDAQWNIPMQRSFEGHIKYLTDLGVTYENVEIESEGLPYLNAPKIRDAILKSPLPVLLFSYSRGGVDTLDALIKYPELLGRIRSWFPMNVPFYGSPIADYVLSKPELKSAAYLLFGQLGGSGDMLATLSQHDRIIYQKTYMENIKYITKHIPTLTYGSIIKDGDPIPPLLKFSVPILLKEGYISDGVVPWESTILPEVQRVIFLGVNHFSGVRKETGPEFDSLKLFKVLLYLGVFPN